jgi:hypothetical protein
MDPRRVQGGTSLVWHNGAFDGFTAFVGFLPQHDLGLTVLNNMTAGPAGIWFYTYVLNLVMSERFGLNVGVPDKVLATEASALATSGRSDRRPSRSASRSWRRISATTKVATRSSAKAETWCCTTALAPSRSR